MSETVDETLPFDVEVERIPAWSQAASALVIVVSALGAARLAPLLVVLPFLVASSLGRRFASAATHVEVSAAALDLGGRVIAREEIVDVWVDDREARATVAFGEHVDVAVLHFDNVPQARRFGEAIGRTEAAVVGVRPRPVDLVGPLRFVGVAAAFFATGAPYGLSVLVFFAAGLWTLLQARQVVVTGSTFEVRTLFGVKTHACADVVEVDLDAGVIRMKNGSEVRLSRAALRDGTLSSAEWLERARAPVLERLRAAK